MQPGAEGRTGILCDDGAVAPVRARARCRANAHIRGEAGDNDSLYSQVPQTLVDPGTAERVRSGFVHYHLAGLWSHTVVDLPSFIEPRRPDTPSQEADAKLVEFPQPSTQVSPA